MPNVPAHPFDDVLNDFVLGKLDGAAPAEIAAELGLSLNAVILAKSRVLKRVREELRGLVE